MSSLSVTKTVRVANVLTDATSFTATVTRTDTGAAVTATATHPSTGKYVWTWTEPAAGLTYTVAYVAVVSGNTQSWSETITGSDTEAEVPLPDLTGDNLVDTLNSLLVERLRVSRNGPKVSYSLHGHTVDWGEYLKYLDERIMQLRKEIAMSEPWEEMGIVY